MTYKINDYNEIIQREEIKYEVLKEKIMMIINKNIMIRDNDNEIEKNNHN